MQKICMYCTHWKESDAFEIEGRADKVFAACDKLGIDMESKGTCPACQTADTSEEELAASIKEARDYADKLLNSVPSAKQPVPKPQVKTVTKQIKRSKIEPVLVKYDPTRPVLKPFEHQQVAVDKYRDEDEIALFFEMGCGKSFTLLKIAEEKFKKGEIKGVLLVAPNDVHRQWFDELVHGVDKDRDGILWQELSIDFEAQCVGGRGGQKELYPFETDNLFKFVSVNVDTFSQPHKWEAVVDWANSDKYMIAIDEATVIKNPDSKRSQRLLYSFNNIKKRGRAIVSSVKKCPVRAVLTGTPVTNGPIDLWSIMEFVKPNFFNRNFYSFRNYYGMFTKLTVPTPYGTPREVQVLLTEKTWHGIHNCSSFEEAAALFGCSEDTYMTIKHQDKFRGAYKHADELKSKLNEVAIFRKLTDCASMPTVNYLVRKVSMSDAQQKVYNSMKQNLLATYAGHTMTAANKLIVNLRLQQISSGFIVGKKSLEDNLVDLSLFTEDSFDAKDIMPDEVVWIDEKNPKLSALMSDIAELSKPILILTRYTAEAAKIFELCEAQGYSTGLFTGWKVVGGIDAFKKGEVDILVANSSKIARGFNLQNCHNTIFYSNTFSMETRLQAEFRTYRLGQLLPCTYIDYVSSPVDELINKALATKKGLLNYIRDRDITEEV